MFAAGSHTGLTPGQVFHCWGATFIAGLISLLATTKAERIPWVRKQVLYRSRHTWAFFVSLFWGLSLLLAPPLRSMKVLAWMAFPIMFSQFLMSLVFGPIQDRIVARIQRRSRLPQ